MAPKRLKRGQEGAGDMPSSNIGAQERDGQTAPFLPGTIEDYQRKKRQRIILLSITLCMAIIFSVIMLFIRGTQLSLIHI